MVVVVMGVCGSGKSTLGKILAERLKVDFLEGDDFHSPANVAKMSRGEPLTESDRAPWLSEIRRTLDRYLNDDRGVVLTCSALTRKSRLTLGVERSAVRLIHLYAPQSVLEKRMARRKDHFMPGSLLQSQLETLETPGNEEALRIDVSDSTEFAIQSVLRDLENR
ncbi:MAG TPA: gluconate kinase [Opitutae bacterium]|jgi:gluconokinase|nr:gluconate kinase [Opitutae bacterium]|tara:strand:- start:732 stop:1226 length:495 start_codon:yes stop_codon:yes gene_type:complete